MLHLKTFGGLSVESDSIPGTGAAQQRKTLALLALLAVAGPRGLSRDKLIACLWPETDGERGRGLLNQACYALRRDLHARDMFLGSIQLRLNPALISSDVESFTSALEQNDPAGAAECYAAPFLDGFYLNGGGEFETWAETERSRLAGQLRGALKTLSADASLRGDHRSAADWWQRLLDLDPLSSPAALGLMTALEQLGERAEALRRGQAHAGLVRSELGTDPPREVAEWIERHRHAAGNGVKGVVHSAEAEEEIEPAVEARSLPVTLGRRAYRTRVLGLTSVVAVLLLLAGAGYMEWKQQGSIGAAEAGAPSGQKMLAVLPFENRGPAADEYFADGLTESIGMRLGGIRSLGVIASQSSGQYKGTTKTLEQIGRELRVQYILQGTVWWDKTSGEPRVRVSPRLLRVADGRQLWGTEYDPVVTGMFALQTSLATKVAAALDVELPTSERHRLEAPTANPEAYEAFLRGVEIIKTGASGNAAESKKAVSLFQRAVTLDSTFVMAYTWLSVTRVILYLSYMDRSPDQLVLGKAAADRAALLDPECDSGSCAALGFYELFVVGDSDKALHELLRSWKARPNDHNLPSTIAHVYMRRGEWDKGLAYLREAVRLNPVDPGETGGVGRVYAVLRQFAAANYYLDRALAGSPELNNARLVKALAYLNLTGDLAGMRKFLPDVSHNVAATGIEDVLISLPDIILMLSEEQQTRLLRLTPEALAGDTAALDLAKGLVLRRRHQTSQARASFDSARVVLEARIHPHPDEDPIYHAMLGLALAGLGRAKDAVKEGE